MARIAKAVASPKRLKWIELLYQAQKPVATLAREACISVKLAGAHHRELPTVRLVDTERQGKHIIYQIASRELPRFWVLLLACSNCRTRCDCFRLLGKNGMARIGMSCCGKRVRGSRVDRCAAAFDADAQVVQARLAELPKDKVLLAYCRGPCCLMSGDAVQLIYRR